MSCNEVTGVCKLTASLNNLYMLSTLVLNLVFVAENKIVYFFLDSNLPKNDTAFPVGRQAPFLYIKRFRKEKQL